MRSNKAFIKDFFWYFLGSAAPMLIGFIKTPVFTRHFEKEAYGYLGLVTITFAYLGMLLFSWIGSCLWRYFNKYKLEDRLKELYSNLGFIYAVSMVSLLILSSIWYFISQTQIVRNLVLFCFFQLLLNQLFLLYMVVIRLEGKAVFYTVFQSARALLGLVMALVLVFVYNLDISALILSLVLVDSLALLILMFINPAGMEFGLKLIKKETLIKLLRYGSAGLIVNVGFLVIASSDRYIIAWLNSLEQVGIYDQVYKISQLSIAAVVTIFFNTINPSLLNELELNYKGSAKLIQKYLLAFIAIGLPVIFYLSLFSKEIASILLGQEFRVGYTIMPFIFVASYLHGFSNFYELRMKFSEKLKRLALIVTGIALMNLVLNLIFVDLYGYQAAAITTTFSYLILFLIFHIFDKKMMAFKASDRKFLLQVILLFAIQFSIFVFLDRTLKINLMYKAVFTIFFILAYLVLFRARLVSMELPIKN